VFANQWPQAKPVAPITGHSSVSSRKLGLVQGVSVSGGPSSPAAAATPAVGSAAKSLANPVLGPVPVLVPVIGDVARAGAVPWNWFVALAMVDGLLVSLIVIRRRRAAKPA
jgi:hypothetical protein